MKKHDLVDATSKSTGVDRQTVRAVLNATAEAARTALSAGESVFLFGLGKLSISRRGEKVARNLKTGEPVAVPPRNVAVYRPSTSVDDAVNARVTPTPGE
jgi:DNA-binding protein HU-beta